MSVCIDGARGNAVYRGHGSLHPGHRCATTTPPIQSLGSQQSSLSPPSTTTTTASSMAFLRTEAVGSGCDQESLAPGGSQHAAAGVARRADGMDAELRDRHQARPSRHSRVRDARAATKAHIPARQSVRVSMSNPMHSSTDTHSAAIVVLRMSWRAHIHARSCWIDSSRRSRRLHRPRS